MYYIKILKLKKKLKKKGGGLYSVKLENEKNFLVTKNQQIYINSLFQKLFFFSISIFNCMYIYSILSYLLFSINCGKLVYFYNSRPNFPFTSRHSYQFASPILSAFQYAAQS